MSFEWVKTTIGEQLTLQRGFDITKATQQPGDVPVISSGGINSFHSIAMATGPGVILGRKGVVGSVYFVRENYWPHDTTLWIKNFHGNDEQFAYYFFLAKVRELEQLDVGSANPTLNRNHVHPIKILWPPLAEQKRIGEILGDLDERITLLRETNTTLEAIAQALFKSWFVDFDPVRAKLDGRIPEGMDEATATLFPDSFNESEIGLVPTGWRVGEIGDVVDYVGGGTPSTKGLEYWEPGEHAWTTPKDLSGLKSPALLRTDRLISSKGLTKVSSGLLPAGTLLLSSRAPIGYLAIAQIPLAINQGYIAMLPSSQLPPLYMLFWCRQNMEVIKSRANGSTFMEISKKAFSPIPSLVPPAPVLDAFMIIASQLFSRLVENEKQAQTLVCLRDVLLPRLVSGQLRLSDTADAIQEAA